MIYAGSLFGWKGVQDLVAAAEWLPGFTITVIGGDPEQVERLRAQAPASGAQIRYLGRLPHTQTLEALSHACIAVLPNRDEPDSAFTSPLKLFEYMAAGCAVVASDLPSLHEVLTNEETAWSPAGDPKALAEVIRTLAASPDRLRSLSTAGRHRAESFSWRARAHAQAKLLQGLARD